MAEQEAVAAQAKEEEEDEETPGYKAPAQKSMDEIVNQDKDDESLVKYKAALLGGVVGGGKTVVDPNDPRRVIVKKLAITVEGRDDLEIDLTQPPEQIKKTALVLKEGCEYKVKIYFYVQHEIVTGLRYLHTVYRKGIKVDKTSCMVGSYGPSENLNAFISPEDSAPSGMISRGDYKMKSKFIDDDKNVHLEWEWVLQIKKDFE